MKKILFVADGFELGGIGKSLINLLNKISSDYIIDLFLLNHDFDSVNKLPHNINIIRGNIFTKALFIPFFESKKNPLLFLLKCFNAIFSMLFTNKLPVYLAIRTIKKLKDYDIAISFSHDVKARYCHGGSNSFVLKRVKAKKKITFIHCDPISSGLITRTFLKKLNNFDSIAFVSKSCAEAFISRYFEFKDKCYVVYNCNNVEKILFESKCTICNFSNTDINFVIVSRLSEQKGIDRLINIIHELNNRNITFHFVGGSAKTEFYKQLVSQYNLQSVIKFWGVQQNPYKFMSKSDMLIIPSFHEAAPVVINEAKILELPILTTNTISAKEMVSNDDGIVCDNDYDQLKQSLEEVVKERKYYDYKVSIKKKKYDNETPLNMFNHLIIETTK